MGRIRVRRSVRRVCFGASIACAAVALAGPGAGAGPAPTDSVDAPAVFRGDASAQGLAVALLTPALVPVENLFSFAVVEGRGTYETATQSARASLLFPGEGLIQGPNLLCGTFIGPQIPPEGEPLFGPLIATCTSYSYPVTVYADSLSPDGSTEGALALGTESDPVSMDATGAAAHAAIDSVTTHAEVSDYRIGGVPALGDVTGLLGGAGLGELEPFLLKVDSAVARTDQRIVEGALEVRAESVLSGVRMLGGLVRIGSIRSVSTIHAPPDEEPVVTTSFEVSGVEVAGSPAQITEDGLVIGSPDGTTGPLAQQAARNAATALAGTGFTVTPLPSEQGSDAGGAFARSAGALVEFTVPLSGLPPVPGPVGDLDLNGRYGVSLQLGSTGVRGIASNIPTTPAPARPAVTPAGGSGVLGSPAFVPPARPAATGSSGSATPPAAPPAAVPIAAPADGLASVVDDLFANRLRLLYLAFTLSALGLCLAPRLTLPARLPGRP